MPSVFLVSDTHFGHLGVCKFTRNDGTKLRPWDSPEEMDEEMVKRWNETVRPTDKVSCFISFNFVFTVHITSFIWYQR